MDVPIALHSCSTSNLPDLGIRRPTFVNVLLMWGSLMRLHETRTASTPNIYVKNPAFPPWAASASRANIAHPSGQLDFCPPTSTCPFRHISVCKTIAKVRKFLQNKRKKREKTEITQIFHNSCGGASLSLLGGDVNFVLAKMARRKR